jgi:hypothetical protein
MNLVKLFDGLIKLEYVALFIDRFERIMKNILYSINSIFDIYINILYINVILEELSDGVQMKDQVAYFFHFIC